MKQLIFFLVLLITISSAVAQTSVLERMQKKFSGSDAIVIQFKQVTSKAGSSGTLTYKKNEMVHLDQKNLLIVSDGKTVWNYNKTQKKVIISNYKQADGSLLSLAKIIIDYPAQCTVTENKAGNSSIITLVPKTKKLGFERAEIKTGKNDSPELITVLSGGNKLSFEISSVQWSASVDNSMFQFLAPEGVKIIDLR